MSESFVQVTPDSTGKLIRNESITTSIAGTFTTVQMQVVNVGDPIDPAGVQAVVTGPPQPGVYGAVVYLGAGQDIATGSRQDSMLGLLQQLAQQILYCDTTSVTIAGGAITISALPAVIANVTGSVAVQSQPLPPNASQESGGNLDQITVALNALNSTLATLNTNVLALLRQLNNQAYQMGAQTSGDF